MCVDPLSGTCILTPRSGKSFLKITDSRSASQKPQLPWIFHLKRLCAAAARRPLGEDKGRLPALAKDQGAGSLGEAASQPHEHCFLLLPLVLPSFSLQDVRSIVSSLGEGVPTNNVTGCTCTSLPPYLPEMAWGSTLSFLFSSLLPSFFLLYDLMNYIFS
jgi:hypothetical protein